MTRRGNAFVETNLRGEVLRFGTEQSGKGFAVGYRSARRPIAFDTITARKQD